MRHDSLRNVQVHRGLDCTFCVLPAGFFPGALPTWIACERQPDGQVTVLVEDDQLADLVVTYLDELAAGGDSRPVALVRLLAGEERLAEAFQVAQHVQTL